MIRLLGFLVGLFVIWWLVGLHHTGWFYRDKSDFIEDPSRINE